MIVMTIVRTTLRLDENLKKEAQLYAVSNGVTLQEVFNTALRAHLKRQKNKQQKQKLLKLRPVDLGINLDNLTRDDIYGEPEID